MKGCYCSRDVFQEGRRHERVLWMARGGAKLPCFADTHQRLQSHLGIMLWQGLFLGRNPRNRNRAATATATAAAADADASAATAATSAATAACCCCSTTTTILLVLLLQVTRNTTNRFQLQSIYTTIAMMCSIIFAPVLVAEK